MLQCTAGLKVITAILRRIQFFRVMTLCCWVNGSRSFEGSLCLQLSGQEVLQNAENHSLSIPECVSPRTVRFFSNYDQVVEDTMLSRI